MEKYIVEKITDKVRLNEIRDDWGQIYQADPNSHIYISWNWFVACVVKANSNWILIVVKDLERNEYVAFLPLFHKNKRKFGIDLLRTIEYAGKPFSVYTGFLCLPENDIEIIKKIAFFLQNNIKWDVFRMRWTRDSRIDTFSSCFSESNYKVHVVDDLESLIIDLPGTTELFYKQFVGRSTRKRTREKINYIKKHDRYRITIADDNTIKEKIEVLCRLWNARWQNDSHTEWYRHFLQYFYKTNLLRLTVLWDHEIPIAALSCISDPINEVYNPFITSYHPEYSKLSPGIVLFAESVEYAIENKFKFYDFTVGMDQYKLSFGSKHIKTKNILIERKSLKTMMFKRTANLVKTVFK